MHHMKAWLIIATVWLWQTISLVWAVAPTTFEYKDDDAQSVAVAGEFNQWQAQEMAKGEDGVWKITLTIEPGEYGYKFLKNGDEWLMDPRCHRVHDVDGVRNSKLIVKAVETGPREWTQKSSGKKITGEITAFDGKNVTVRNEKGNELQLPIAMLSDDDLKYANAWQADQALTSQAAPTVPADGWAADLVPGGEPIRWRIDLPELPRKTKYGDWPDDRKGPIQIEVAVSIPEGFDPNSEDNWIGVVSATSDANSKSCDALSAYSSYISKANMVGIAADIVAEGDEMKVWAGIATRWQLFYLAREEMMKTWPKMNTWTYVTIGASGGGGYSIYFATAMNASKWDVGGILANVSTYQVDRFKDYIKTKSSFYRTVPIFYSFGKNDTVATPAVAQNTIDYAARKMKYSRAEWFDGGHDIHGDHVDTALLWFKTVRGEQKQKDGKSSME